MKKPQANSSKKKKRSTTTSPAGSNNTKASQINRANQKKGNSSKKKEGSAYSPPWQVVSKKDRVKNVKAEKERRKLAKEQGMHNIQVDTSGMELSKSFLSAEEKSIIAWKRFKTSPSQDQVEFIGAYLNKQLPPRLGAPEIAFLGRSNVGKSSLLNQLVSSDSARVGKTPGATASVNLYGVYRKEKALLGLVDLPGFGYAKLSKEAKEAVQIAAENYLEKRQELVLGILLVDIRRVPSDDDRAVLAALYDSGVPIIIVATKMDKVSKNDQEQSLEVIRKGLGLPEGQPLCVSSATGQGIKDLWRIIMEACEDGVQELRTKLLEQGSDDTNDDYLVDDERGEIAYSQGFDWIHDSASVRYEEDDESSDWVGWDAQDEGDHEFDGDSDTQESNDYSMERQSMRFLKKQAKAMEKRGEFS
jgi:GTP-binding protein